MPITAPQLIQKYNEVLTANNQELRVLEYSSTFIQLSTVPIFGPKEIRLFRTRLNSKVTCGLMDKIYSYPDAEQQTRCVAENQAALASATTKQHWNNLPTEVRASRAEHMRQIRQLVDLTTRRQPVPWNKGLTKHNDARLLKNSVDRSGENNPMYGVSMTDEARKIKSNLMKNKIAAGKWTPHVHNSRTHWESKCNGKPYRSSWEAMYSSLNLEDEYETLRIPYIGADGELHIYIVDFVNHSEKNATEIKPKSMANTETVRLKEAAAQNWCLVNGYTFRTITEEYFIEHIHRVDFTCLEIPNVKEKLAKLYEINKTNCN